MLTRTHLARPVPGNPLDSTTTSATGFYDFTDLAAGNYKVKFHKPPIISSAQKIRGATIYLTATRTWRRE
ncbi:MAG: hypothetical protein IH991_24985 [Planctomycetes bacterium]|nr:hypothetical protein [Planctomycetota bacterium]